MRTVILDSQLLSSLQRCAQRTDFYFNQNLRMFETPHQLQRGILIHTFLAEYYNLRKNSGNNLDWESCAHGAEKVAKPFSCSLTLPESDIANVFRSLSQYVEHTKYEPMEVHFVEEPFAITLYENEEEDLRIVYVGVIDLIATLQGQEQKVFDHKSQSRKSDYLVLDDQFEGYATAAGTNILTVNVIGLQLTVPPQEKFRRVPLSYPPFLLERWKGHVVYWVKQYIVWASHNEWPENHQGCNKFNICEFYDVCTSVSDAARDWKLKANFIEGEKWDPTKVLNYRE